MITIDNYEEYALDYLEGNLKPTEVAAMHAFLAVNPEVREELNRFTLFTLTANETEVFSNKNALLKPENATPKVVALPSYLNYYRIAAVAASIALLLGTSVYFYKNNLNITPTNRNVAAITPIKKAENKPSQKNSEDKGVVNNTSVNNSETAINTENKQPKMAIATINGKNSQAVIMPKNEQKSKDFAKKTLGNMVDFHEIEKNKKNNAPTVTFAAAPAINDYTNSKNTPKSSEAAANTSLEEKRESIALAELPTIDRIQDFYFTTEEEPVLVIALTDFNLPITNSTAHLQHKNNKLIKALTPEASLEKKEAKFWEAFIPETRNTAHPTAFLESLRPAAYSK